MHIKISTFPRGYRWEPTSVLRIWGADAANFLQGQFSNDVRTLEEGGECGVYGLWLTVKGKVLADSFLLRGAAVNEYWAVSYFSSAVVIRERLEEYVIADDVSIEDRTQEWAGVGRIGGAAGVRPAGAMVFAGRRAKAGAVELLYRRGEAEPAGWMDGGEPLVAEDLERLRIDAGIPSVPRDAGGDDLPNEAGLELAAVSYTKGCYLGQEVMARLKAMGQVRRRLVRVSGAGGDAPQSPVALWGEGRRVGELRSAVADGEGGWIGLAMVVRLNAPGAGGVLRLGDEQGPAVRLEEAP